MKSLLLYYRPTCPYCAKVLGFMRENSITLEMKNLEENSEFRQELIKIGGKGQIPCVIIDGQAMYESDDIINWLKENLIQN